MFIGYRYNQGMSLISKTYLILVLALLGFFAYWYQGNAFDKSYTLASAFQYPQNYARTCENKNSAAADHLQRKSAQNIAFSVTTPSNYRSDFAHPLLVVWAPSGYNERSSERFTGLTQQATEQGYVVVHPRSIPLGIKALKALGMIPAQVVDDYCIDPSLIFFTGHSDGGTISNALAVMPELTLQPKALAPSAMGMRGQDMQAYGCPQPTSVMLMHNKEDQHFPGFGHEVINWWANCNRCTGEVTSSDHQGCIQYAGCTDGVITLFCEAKGGHTYWPGPEHQPLRFFTKIISAFQ